MKNKEYFKTTSAVQLMANMSCGLFVMMIAALVLWLIKGTTAMLVLFAGSSGLYVVGYLLAIVSLRKIKDMVLEGKEQRLVKRVRNQAYWFLMPFPFVYSIQYLRNIMWNLYSHEKTKDMEKSSDIARANLELLEELHADGYISQIKYDNQKPKLEEQLQFIIAREEMKKQAPAPKKEDEEEWV